MTGAQFPPCLPVTPEEAAEHRAVLLHELAAYDRAHRAACYGAPSGGWLTVRGARPGATLDAAGSRRRLQALMACGHTFQALAAALSWEPHRVRAVLDCSRVSARTAQAVAAVYGRMWDAAPDEGTPRAARDAARARRQAATAGWAVPMAWDDDDDDGHGIDDPAAVPAEGWQRHDTKLRSSAALVEDADFIIATQGCDRPTAAGRLGLASRHALDTAYLRVAARTAAATEDPADEDVTDAA